jgi:hypothetical protein
MSVFWWISTELSKKSTRFPGLLHQLITNGHKQPKSSNSLSVLHVPYGLKSPE